ncbi:MAG: hypothetical protein WKF97_04995 [Chitinophagaceae bacterium]
MKTKETEVIICETCQITLQTKKVEAHDLDINRLSLLSMFAISNFYLLQCPNCKSTELQIA